MAMLQGSLDNFTLDEVLSLLAGAHKSGHLRITGDRGTGSLWVQDGELVQAEASNVTTGGDWEDVLFELLRFESGNFSFVADDMAPSPSEPESVAPLVERGRELLVEWKSIEGAIRTLDHFLTPVKTLPSEQVMLTSSEWETIVAIGEGRTVAQTCGRLGIGEFKGCRHIKTVVERGLAVLDEPSLPRRVALSDPEQSALAEASVDTPPSLEDHDTNTVPIIFASTGSSSEPSAAVPPPPPAPPSPDEIRQFGETGNDPSTLSEVPPPPPPPPPGINPDGSAAADDEASLLMKYLQSEN